MELTQNVLKTVVFFILLIFAFILAESSNIKQMSILKHKKMVIKDSGQSVNCGTVPINITWTPKDVSPSGEVTISVNYILPHPLDSGFFNASLYFHGDTLPFIGYADDYDCDKIKQYIPFCPLPKGLPIIQKKTITNLHILTSYPGTYDAIIQVWNSQQQEMFCVNLTLTVLETENYPDF